MSSTINVIVLVLGLLFGVEAFAICVTIGESLGTSILQASGWWGAFSISHLFAYRIAKPRRYAPQNDAQTSMLDPGQ